MSGASSRPTEVSRGYPVLLFGTVTALAGFLLWGGPKDPDVFFAPESLLGALLITLFFVGSVVCWGSLWLRISGVPELGTLGKFLLGSVGASLAAQVLGQLGWIGLDRAPLFLALLSVGYLAEAFCDSKNPGPRLLSELFPSRGPESRADYWVGRAASAGVIFFLGAFLLKGSAIQSHSDPVMYHLLGPRDWVLRGKISFLPEQSAVYFCSYWENIFIWGQLLLGGPGNRGLIENHLFAQWIQVLLGGVGCAFAIREIWRPIARFPWLLPVAVACGLLGAGRGEITAVIAVAKNDWGAFFWLLAGIALLFDSGVGFGDRLKLRGLAGFVLGVALMAKLNGAYAIGTFGALWIYRDLRKNGPRVCAAHATEVALFGFLGMLPMLLRNWAGTGNPLFPFGNGIFPSSVISSSVRHFLAISTGGAGWENSYDFNLKLSSFLGATPFNWVFLFGVPLLFSINAIAGRKTLRPLVPYWLCTVLSIAWYFVMHFKITHFDRWMGAPLLLTGGLSILAIAHTLLEFGTPLSAWVLRGLVVVAIATGVLETGQGDFSRAWAVSSTDRIRDSANQLGGAGKAWLRINASPDDLIVTTGDNELYYVSGFRISSIQYDPKYDAFFETEWDPERFAEVLEESGVKYVLDTDFYHGMSWGGLSFRLQKFLRENPYPILFRGPGARVISVDLLASAFPGVCFEPVGDPLFAASLKP